MIGDVVNESDNPALEELRREVENLRNDVSVLKNSRASARRTGKTSRSEYDSECAVSELNSIKYFRRKVYKLDMKKIIKARILYI